MAETAQDARQSRILKELRKLCFDHPGPVTGAHFAVDVSASGAAYAPRPTLGKVPSRNKRKEIFDASSSPGRERRRAKPPKAQGSGAPAPAPASGPAPAPACSPAPLAARPADSAADGQKVVEVAMETAAITQQQATPQHALRRPANGGEHAATEARGGVEESPAAAQADARSAPAAPAVTAPAAGGAVAGSVATEPDASAAESASISAAPSAPAPPALEVARRDAGAERVAYSSPAAEREQPWMKSGPAARGRAVGSAPKAPGLMDLLEASVQVDEDYEGKPIARKAGPKTVRTLMQASPAGQSQDMRAHGSARACMRMRWVEQLHVRSRPSSHAFLSIRLRHFSSAGSTAQYARHAMASSADQAPDGSF